MDNQHAFAKPRGLWVSVKGENDWPSWCRAEEFRLDDLAFAQEIRLALGAQIIRLKNAADIDFFTAQYGRQTRFTTFLGELAIDWSAVARDYQGIIIAPYVWERRLHRSTSWYYGWDCAAACIWDAAAVAEILDADPS